MTVIPDNFLGLPPKLSNLATARYAVLPVPYEGTVSYETGTFDGPRAIITASQQVEHFDEELRREFTSPGVATLPLVPPAVTPAEEMKRIRAAAAPVIESGKFLLTLGGEHSITAPIIELVQKKYGPISVLQLDAHADLRDSFRGTTYSHGSVMRRVLATTQRLCQVGIRSYSAEEADQCPEQVANFITPQVIREDPRWIDRALALLTDKVYITIDIDGLDPAVAPGTGTPEPDGLSWHQALSLLRRVCAEREVVGADIVEVRPIPPNQITEYVAARLGAKVIAYTQK